ncbi:MAG TPA: hypothetical protein H9878_16450 [Candidatus Dietzia merdigallinarum]|nr:hypothetical protein [Candidatus Dietzia merdigallinarum]
MSEDQTTTEATEATEVDDQTTETLTEDQPQATENPNAEAAKYRHRAKEAEAERDALAEKVTTLRRAAVEDRLKTHRVPPAGFWASGIEIDALLDDDGQLDDEAIKAAADKAVEELGLERTGQMRPVPSEGFSHPGRSTPSWEAAFGAK